MIAIRSTVLVCALLLSCRALAPGPANARMVVRPGVEFGIGRSSVDYDDPLPFWDNGWATSFTAGARVELRYGPHFGLLTGARFAHSGNHVEYATTPTDPFLLQQGKFGLRVDEVRVPLLLRLSPFWARRLQITIGPEAAFVTAAHFRLVRDIERYDPTLDAMVPRHEAGTTNIFTHVRTSRLDARSGIGWAFPLRGHRGLVDLRVTRALTDGALDAGWFSTWKPFDVTLVTGVDW